MEPRPGTKADTAPLVRFCERRGTVALDPAMEVRPAPEGGPAAAAARWLGFVLLAGLGLLIVAGVVLLPAVARYRRAQYERACLEAKNADDEALILSYERLAKGIADDPILTKRLAMREFGFLPQDEVVLPAAVTSARSQGKLVTAERQPLPAPPDAWLLAAAANVAGPVKRTVLLLLAIALMAAAVTLTNPWAGRTS